MDIKRLKAVPWTQILLALILATQVMSYFELRRVESYIDDVRSAVEDLHQ